MEKKILINRVQCKRCGEIITSKSTHNLIWCKCGSVAVDGGTDYLRRLTHDPAAKYVELSKYEK